MHKKAVSPLIATVLLIVVAVGIGAVVTGIVRNFVTENKDTIEERSELISCSRDVLMEMVTIDTVPQICKGANYIDATIENTGGAIIDDMQLVIFGTSGIYTNDSLSASDSFAKGEAQEFNGTFVAASVGTIEQVKFVPKLKQSGKTGYNYCSEAALAYESIEDC